MIPIVVAALMATAVATNNPEHCVKDCNAHEPMVTTTPSACAEKCLNDFHSCKSKPNSNQSYCASMIAECLGYNPFENGGLDTPTTCANEPSPTSTKATAQDECAEKCVNEFYECKSKPNANQSFCASEIIKCVGYNPFKNGFEVPTTCKKLAARATPTADACAQKCLDKWYDCKGGSDPNQSYCAATLSKCVGYNPFENGFEPPTSCKTASGTIATSTQTAQPTQDACAKKCTDEWNTCRRKPGANQSLCSSNFGNCLGYAPFLEPGKFTTPTACSKTGSKTAVGTTWVPTSTKTDGSVVTGAAGHLESAVVLAALGVAAVL